MGLLPVGRQDCDRSDEPTVPVTDRRPLTTGSRPGEHAMGRPDDQLGYGSAMATLVFTMIGVDRPGLVDRVSGVVAEHGGNWERSRMARLGGRFAGVVEITVPDPRADALRSSLADLEGTDGLRVSVEDAGRDAPDEPTDRPTVVLSVTGTDRPGLVHAVSAALAGTGANIEEFTSATTNAPMSGGPLFVATATVSLSEHLGPDELRAPLEALADHLMVDIDVSG